jgi:hypothetical protein
MGTTSFVGRSLWAVGTAADSRVILAGPESQAEAGPVLAKRERWWRWRGTAPRVQPHRGTRSTCVAPHDGRTRGAGGARYRGGSSGHDPADVAWRIAPAAWADGVCRGQPPARHRERGDGRWTRPVRISARSDHHGERSPAALGCGERGNVGRLAVSPKDCGGRRRPPAGTRTAIATVESMHPRKVARRDGVEPPSPGFGDRGSTN